MAGFNTEVLHRGVAFHVQTEDKGPGAHYVETVVYCSGRVLTSRKFSYAHLLVETDRAARIQRFVEEMHSAVIQDIRAGKLDHL